MSFAEYVLWLPSRQKVEEVERTLAADGYTTRVVSGDGEGISWQVHARVDEPPTASRHEALINDYFWPLAERFGGSLLGGSFTNESGGRTSWSVQRARRHS